MCDAVCLCAIDGCQLVYILKRSCDSWTVATQLLLTFLQLQPNAHLDRCSFDETHRVPLRQRYLPTDISHPAHVRANRDTMHSIEHFPHCNG